MRHSFLRAVIVLLLVIAAVFCIYYLLNRDAALETLDHAVSTVQNGISGAQSAISQSMPEPFTGELEGSSGLEVYFIDVGQGNSTLLISPSGKTMLIDAGERSAYAVIAPLLRAKGITRLDTVVATHPHNDHIGAMSAIITRFAPKRLYLPDVSYDSLMYEDMLAAVSVRNVDVRRIYAGDPIEWDEAVAISVLSPIRGADSVSLNDWSIVLRIVFGDDSLLLMADAESIAEALMLGMFEKDELGSDLMQLGHHGSESSTGEAFIRAVDPSMAVVSCGKDNDYGHPDRVVLALLDKYDIPLFRTDENGTVHAVLSGNGISAEAES